MDTNRTSLAGGDGAAAAACGEPLATRLEQLLRDSPYSALRHIRCRCDRGTVTLTGQVPSFHLKQMAQTLAGNVDGVERVINRLEVLH